MDMKGLEVLEVAVIEVMVLQVTEDLLRLLATHLPTSPISILLVVIQVKEILAL